MIGFELFIMNLCAWIDWKNSSASAVKEALGYCGCENFASKYIQL